MKKIAFVTALVLGTASAAFAEDSSSSFAINVYGQLGQTGKQQVLINRDVSLSGHVNPNTAFDRASNPYAGGGF
jgi:hypothetical protein